MKKRLSIILLALSLVTLTLASCTGGLSKITNELSSLEATNNVFFDDGSSISNGTDVFEDLPRSNGAYVFYNGELYYSATRKNSLMDYSELIYKLDIATKSSELVYEKRGLANAPAFSIYKDGKIHFQYNYTLTLDPSATVCEYYDLASGNTGTCASLENITDNYITVENGIFRIVEQKSGSIYYITEELLSTQGFDVILNNSFVPAASSNANGHILVSYMVSSGKLTKDYLYVVFEYLPQTNELVFQTHFTIEDKLKEPDFDLYYVIYE